jgi:hypothetical protein
LNDDDFVGPDVGIYGTEEPFPGAFVGGDETSIAWGRKIYQVIVWPFEYLPALTQLDLNTLDV